MSEHPGLEFIPQTPRSPILPSMLPLVLFIISMGATTSAAIFKSLFGMLSRPADFFSSIVFNNLVTVLTDGNCKENVPSVGSR